jgi:beta-fructofuranosidase
MGALERVLDWGPRWHVNDHCFIEHDGVWHLFGIVSPDPGEPVPSDLGLGHATAPTPQGPWQREDYALHVKPEFGETVLWAPQVVRTADGFAMVYCSGGDDLTHWGISLAVSDDLRTWTRVGTPLFRDGFQARDPFLWWDPDDAQWVLYYTATEQPAYGRHVVAFRTSPDLTTWSQRRIAFRDEHEGDEYGPTESPVVVARDGRYYLFIGPRPYDRPTDEVPNWDHAGYDGTDVFCSTRWDSWDDADLVAHLPVHAPEVVQTDDGRWFISSGGIKRGGVHLAPLRWLD